MSDYFGALMKSSGLAVGAGVASRLPMAQGSNPVPADYGIEEVDGRPIAAPSGSAERMDRPSSPPQTLANRHNEADPPKPAAKEPPARATPPLCAFAEEAGEPASGLEGQATLRPNPATITGPATGHAPPARAEPPLTPHPAATSPGLAMVQAAMRWVAVGEKADEAGQGEPSASAPRFVSMDLSDGIRPGGSAEALADRPTAEERTEAFFKPPMAGQIAYPQREESLASIRTPADRRHVANTSFAGEEVVDISIGSIHVRVDAPPPPLVALTTPPPANGNTPEPPRSGFSRRSLWRI